MGMTGCSLSSPIKTACVSWLTPFVGSNALAVSLNYRANIAREPAVAAAKQFWHRIDCQVLGRGVKKGIRVPRVCVLEGDGVARNYHYHALVELPHGWTFGTFEALLKGTWESLHEAGRYTKIDPCYHAAGWLDYICKEAKADVDCVCLHTSYLPLEPRSPMGA